MIEKNFLKSLLYKIVNLLKALSLISYKGNKGVFHVFHVNRSVNIFLLHRKKILFSKNMVTDLLTWNT